LMLKSSVSSGSNTINDLWFPDDLFLNTATPSFSVRVAPSQRRVSCDMILLLEPRFSILLFLRPLPTVTMHTVDLLVRTTFPAPSTLGDSSLVKAPLMTADFTV